MPNESKKCLCIKLISPYIVVGVVISYTNDNTLMTILVMIDHDALMSGINKTTNVFFGVEKTISPFTSPDDSK